MERGEKFVIIYLIRRGIWTYNPGHAYENNYTRSKERKITWEAM